MLLRKYLMGGRIVYVEQHDFDRIVKIGVERAGVHSNLIVELFAPGNILIVDSENRIILPMNPVTMKDRRLRSGEIYELPEAQISPLKVKDSDLLKEFSRSTSDIVRTVATRFNLGGVLAEEVCARAGIDKSKPSKEATEEDASMICNAMHDLFSPLLRIGAGDKGHTEAETETELKSDIESKPETELKPKTELKPETELKLEAGVEGELLSSGLSM